MKPSATRMDNIYDHITHGSLIAGLESMPSQSRCYIL